MCGLETVPVKKRQEAELKVVMLRISLGVMRMDRIRNEAQLKLDILQKNSKMLD